MLRRAVPQRILDERRFRFRVRFERPGTGMWDSHKTLHAWLDARLGKNNYAFHPDTWEGHGLACFALHFDDHTIIPDLLAHYAAIETIAHRKPKFWATVARADLSPLRDAIFYLQQSLADKLNAEQEKVTWVLGVCNVHHGVAMKLGDRVRLQHIHVATEIDTLLSHAPPDHDPLTVALEDPHRGTLEAGLSMLQDLRPQPLAHIDLMRRFLDSLTVIPERRLPLDR